MAGKAGFAGLGNMGGPMARNLLQAGFTVVVHDLDPRKVQALAEAGAEAAAAARAVARDGTLAVLVGGDTAVYAACKDCSTRWAATCFTPVPWATASP